MIVYEQSQTCEFRWVIRPTESPSRVLQQRWEIFETNHDRTARMRRTEWRDVPVEREEAKPA